MFFDCATHSALNPQVRKQPEVQELREYQKEMRNVRERAQITYRFNIGGPLYKGHPKAPAKRPQHFRPTSCWKSMFDRLAASLNIAFKWLSMFDLDQTFSSNILLHEQMFDRFATPCCVQRQTPCWMKMRKRKQ